MARQPRVDIAGEVFHVINRANGRVGIFETAEDYEIILKALEEVKEVIPIDIFSFCIMPNHWHFSVRPKEDGDMGEFFGKCTQKITQRWHVTHKSIGSGHLFQGRFKSFMVQEDGYFLNLMEYIEANALRAKLVERAEDWKWGSLYLRKKNKSRAKGLLSPWPMEEPLDYLETVNKCEKRSQIEQIRNSVVKGNPLGEISWMKKMLKKYNLGYTVNPRGRPKK